MTLTIRQLPYSVAQPAVQAIRTQVFQIEQGIDPALEFDEHEATAWHWVATIAAQPVGTVRLRSLSPEQVKVERLAVLAPYRGQGIGQALMQAVLTHVRSQPHLTHVKLHAQLPVQSFYERLGFMAIGAVFLEAGVPHITMVQTLS